MRLQWLMRLSPRWRARWVRVLFNLHPAFRGTGGRVIHVSDDFRCIRIRLPFSWRTRNIVGSIYGGSLFAVTDGSHPMMLMAALGKDYVLWDKSASIRYRRPGYTTLEAACILSDNDMALIQERLRTQDELEHCFVIELKDGDGVVYAIVERTVYIAHKHHYTQKTT